MSLFGGLQGAVNLRPDVVINGHGGNLLPNSSSGIRFSDARINQQQNLLQGVKPYNYGPGSVSDDIAQQVTPHKVQKIIPKLSFPSTDATTDNKNIVLSHSVDDGDLAFAIRILHNQDIHMKNYQFYKKNNITRAVDTIVNLATVNYLLRGLQTDIPTQRAYWEQFLSSTGWPSQTDTMRLDDFKSGKYQHRNISMFIQDYIRPIGVVIGSDHQGGQHQGDPGACDFPVDFVATLLVDGLCDNLMNLWRGSDINAGDDLLLVLVGNNLATGTKDTFDFIGDEPNANFGYTTLNSQPPLSEAGPLKHQVNTTYGINPKKYYGLHNESCYEYVLNHWKKEQQTVSFGRQGQGLVFELVPTTSSEIDMREFLENSRKNRGLWHIGRSQVQIRGRPTGTNIFGHRNDNANLQAGALIQATIAPMWKAATKDHKITLHHKTKDQHGRARNKDYNLPYTSNAITTLVSTVAAPDPATVATEIASVGKRPAGERPVDAQLHAETPMKRVTVVAEAAAVVKRSVMDVQAGPTDITGEKRSAEVPRVQARSLSTTNTSHAAKSVQATRVSAGKKS